jgi:hypothetical protein
MLNNSPIKTRLYHHGSHGGVVQAHYEHIEEAICFVTFAVSGRDIVITSYGVNPRVAAEEAQLAGNEIDKTLAELAAKHGVTKLFIIHPNNTTEFVREYKIQPCVMGFGVTSTHHTYIN